MWTVLFLAIMPPPDASTGSAPPFASQSVAAAKLDAKSQVQSQIESLASGVFAKRERATADLIRAGISAAPCLEATLQSTNVEVRSRSLRIFAEWLNSDDPKLAAAAEAALKRAADGKETVAKNAQMRLAANYLRREAELLAEMDRMLPLLHLVVT
jgi:hypothetical protein